MPIKRYGIYIAYPPTVDLRNEGLGRYLANFVKGAAQSTEAEFLIACPSWSKEALEDLFRSEGLAAHVSVICPAGKPWLLRAYEIYQTLKRREHRQEKAHSKPSRFLKALQDDFEKRLVEIHNPTSLVPFLISGLSLFALLLAYLPLNWMKLFFSRIGRIITNLFSALRGKLNACLARLTTSPKENSWVRRQFKFMNDFESKRMQVLIEAREDVVAWYSPTAFWPAFNKLRVPRVMCVPDVVLTDFSIGFASVGGNRFLETFKTIEQSLRGATSIVTYSNHTKWHTLVDHFSISPSHVSVIPHASNTLNQLIDVDGFPDPVTTSRNYCKKLLLTALQRVNTCYTALFLNSEVRFLFYPSQVRPNKNMLTLLRAFKHLVRDRKLGLKLILTGDVASAPELIHYIEKHRLQTEVICLRGLSTAELAACYRLAELAVNPSLSEGGCPFTFTEALSVGTPVVMSRIAVTLEVLTDRELQQGSLFDPYDWRDMAARIEWAILNRAELLSLQQQTYTRLSERTWADVAREHTVLLDTIAARENTQSRGELHVP